jgi:DNA mismatch repair ATPase MutS
MGKIYKLIEQDAILSKVLCDKLQHCRRLFKIDNTIECEDFTDNITFNYDFFSSAESKMLDMLVHIDDSSSFFNIDLCEFFVLFDHFKDLFIKPMLEMADIETYISIHEFINSPEQKGHWCLAEFVEDVNDDGGKPYVYAEDVWNPFLAPGKAIKNTIELGGNKVHSERFAVLSGINYGGKTTLMNAITYAIIMSHLFGVAPAKRFKTSRFAKIHVMNSGDTDIANNDSKFSKEIRLCSLLLSKIKNTHTGENVWINSDEMFSGTDPLSAGKLCMRVMQEISSNENTLGTYATHYSEPTRLQDKDKNFKNYHMGYNIKDKDIEFTNKILEGKAEKSIAKYLLRKVILRDKIPYFDDILKRFFPDEVKK